MCSDLPEPPIIKSYKQVISDIHPHSDLTCICSLPSRVVIRERRSRCRLGKHHCASLLPTKGPARPHVAAHEWLVPLAARSLRAAVCLHLHL